MEHEALTEIRIFLTADPLRADIEIPIRDTRGSELLSLGLKMWYIPPINISDNGLQDAIFPFLKIINPVCKFIKIDTEGDFVYSFNLPDNDKLKAIKREYLIGSLITE